MGPLRAREEAALIAYRALRRLAASLPALLLLHQGSLQAAGWKLAWSDEFNGPDMDTSLWGYEIGYVRNQEVQYYSRRPENSRIEDGKLLIQALRDGWQGHAYTSASRTTRGRKSFLYGRFELRARIDIRMGSWPAWWWLPNSGGWPRGGEIDMMEFYQGKCLLNVMDGNGLWTSPTRSIASLGGPRWAEEFHTWTMDWDSTRIRLSLDGAVVNDYRVADADGTGPSGANPFRRAGYLILNQAIGGTRGGDPSGTVFPVRLEVDWVRHHAWSPEASRNLVVTGGTGGGAYVVGARASLTAHMPPAGQVFDRWVAVSGNPDLDDSASPSTRLTMPDRDAAVAATYRVPGLSAIRLPRAGRAAPAGRLGFHDVRGRKVLRWRGGEGGGDGSAPEPVRILFPGP